MSEYLVRRINGDASLVELESFPSYFEIETVNACNAKCPMCTIDDWDRRDGLMSDELFEKIADEIAEHSDTIKRVQLFRDGEPLLDKKLAGRTAMMKARGVKRVGISTNASLLNRRKSIALLAAGLDEVILSIDSLIPATYEAIRKGLRFDVVMDNILGFIDVRNAMHSTCQAWVRMIRQESNRHEWPIFERFWKPKLRETDRIDYRNIHNWGSQLVGFKQIAPANTEKPCVALWSLMVIFADGSVPLCNVDYNNKHPLGSIHVSTIAELWQSHEQNRRRSLHLSGDRGIPMCKGCTVWSEEANTEGERMAA